MGPILKEATWSFEMSRNILLAALALATFSFPARADSFDPKTSGAVYGKLDLETAKANDEAVASTIEKIAKSGGGDLILTGSLAITQAIEPPTIVFNGTAGYPMHFGIRGDILAELVDVDGGVAINFPAPTFPGNLPGYELRQPIRDLGVRGGGIVIGGGGKFITLRRVSICSVKNCPIALSVTNYDGGHLEDVNIHECPDSTGFKIVKSHHSFVDLTSRSNAVGGIITGSVLFGAIICESCAGDGLVCDDVSRSSLACWCEGNKGRMAVFTNCFLNVFTAGKIQADSNEVILDVMSRNLNKWPSTPQSIWPVGNQISVCHPTRTTFPAGFVDLRGDDITIHANAFLPANSVSPNGIPCSIELTASGQDNCGGSWKAGDCLVVSITIIPNAAATAFYGKQHMYFNTGCKTGTSCEGLSQSWSIAGSEQRLVLIGSCPAAGSGLRLFMYPQSGVTGPTGDIKLTVNADIRKLQ
jgi:hypothetical protein